MRRVALFALLLPGTAFADQILATSHITAVTVYPIGAQITREVSFTAPAGPHELLITDLPAETQPELLRLSSDSASLGAFALRTDRLPPRDLAESPERTAAKAAVDAAEAGLRATQAKIDAINARVEAADAQAGFLRGVKSTGDAITADGLKTIAAMIGTEVLAARQTALAAAADLPAAQQALADAQEALTKAQDALAALSQADTDYVALSVAVDLPAAGEAHLTVTNFTDQATWQPVYDAKLTRKPEPSLTLDRGILVSQYSGEDWVGVDLTLSTAQPSAQAEPSQLWPYLRRVEDEQPEAKADDAMGYAPAEAVMEPAVVVSESLMIGALAGLQGDVVVYRYPTPVDIATDVENLRLALDEMKFIPEITAIAVPRRDETAFFNARFSNDSAEILLPGTAYLYREGELVGSTDLETLAPGAKTDIGFGAIDGLRLTRDMPQRAQGDRGVFTSSTQIEVKAVLKVENLSTESWPVRLLDQVPYSEQEDLTITYTANPKPSETDVDGQRGILAWDFDLPPGEVKEIELNHVLSWPAGKVLQ